MGIIEHIKHDLWSFLKTRLYLWWWIVRYRGRKNIPPEVVFAQMARSMEHMNRNLELARKALTDDEGSTKKEIGELYDVINKVEEFEKKIDKVKRDRISVKLEK